MTQREVIISHAAKMFVEQGVKAVRMDNIAQELSVSKRTLYEIFGDKEGLLYESIKHYSEVTCEVRAKQIAELDNDLEIMLLNLRSMVDQAPTSFRMRRNIRRFYPAVYNRLNDELSSKAKMEMKSWVDSCIVKGYFDKNVNADFVVEILQNSSQGIFLNETEVENTHRVRIEMMTYSLIIFIRGLCTPKGMKIIDDCFNKYFGTPQI